MTRVLPKTVFKKMWQGEYTIAKGLVPYELKICKICDGHKPTVLFDGQGACNICKDCANIRGKEKRKAKTLRWQIEKDCRVCKAKFVPYSPLQKVCSEACRHRRNQIVKEDNPLRYRAICLTSTVVGLKDKRQIVEEMIKESLGKKCPYCGVVLVLSECSLDHKTPLMRNKDLTYERKVTLNQRENLQIICRRCNGLKAEFSDSEYSTLLIFCRENPTIGEKIFKRLARSAIMWKFKKSAGH